MIYRTGPARMRGVSRSSRFVGRDAMDALCRKACGVSAYGQAVWSRPLDAGVKFAGDPQATEANKPDTPGRARSSRSNHCAGSAGLFGFTCSDYARLLFSFANEAAGAASARHSLRPLFPEGRCRCTTRAIHAAGMRRHVIPCPVHACAVSRPRCRDEGEPRPVPNDSSRDQ